MSALRRSSGFAMAAKDELIMEYLVTMTTHVPDGTSNESVEDVRSREAARSQGLAKQGHLLRLWRPPLQPGEWRTLGLFSASDEVELEGVLASMPLHVWRHDEVMLLLPHPNDPARQSDMPDRSAPGTFDSEFLVTFAVTVPAGTPSEVVDATNRHEAERARELAGQGHLLRLWRLPDRGRALGNWQADDPAHMQAMLEALPLHAWMSEQTTMLSPHPSDPARISGL
jgi:muconolactone delta-isomerase